jgi:hypothetical protein
MLLISQQPDLKSWATGTHDPNGPETSSSLVSDLVPFTCLPVWQGTHTYIFAVYAQNFSQIYSCLLYGRHWLPTGKGGTVRRLTVNPF